MKDVSVNFIVICILFLSCKMSNHFPDMIIRQNNFDSNYYSLNKVDTNKVNRSVYLNLLDKIQFSNDTKCFLMKMYSDGYVWEEYGLYDYNTGKYFYTSIKNDDHFKFKRVDSIINQEVCVQMQKFINNPELLDSFTFASAKSNFYDGVNVEVSLISFKTKNEVLVKSYHW